MPAALPLEPQVKGRLADKEAELLKLLQEGAGSWKTALSLDPELALAVVRAADRETRDFSNFVAVALKEYCETHGQSTAEQSEVLGKLALLLDDQPELIAELERFLKQQRRRKVA